MIGNQPACDAFTAQAEGGYTADPADPGNWTGGACGSGTCNGTKYGIAASQHPEMDIESLTVEQAAQLRAPYWVEVGGDKLPKGLDLAVYDFGITSGPGRSVKALQQLLGVTQDGEIGPDTVAALAGKDTRNLITEFCYLRTVSTTNSQRSPGSGRAGSRA